MVRSVVKSSSRKKKSAKESVRKPIKKSVKKHPVKKPVVRSSKKKVVKKVSDKKLVVRKRSAKKKIPREKSAKKVVRKSAKKNSVKKRPAKKSVKKKSVKQKIVRVPTGIKNFDRLVEGGFEKNSTNLLVGSSGSGKTVFSVEFLVEGIRRGEKCLMVSFEEPRKALYDNMYELGYDLEELEKKGKFFFIEHTPEKVKRMLEEGGGEIETIVLSEKIDRIVIDSATSFILLFDKELEKKEAALSLFNLLKGWNCTSLLISEENPLEARHSSRVLDLEADSIILLYFLEGKRERERFVEVLKMRGTNHSLKVHKYDIKKGGIVVSTSPSKMVRR